MRYFWPGLLAIVVFGPLAMLAMLLAEAAFPALDDVTLAMPLGMRAMVSQMALRQAGDDAETERKVFRVVKLDPENEAAWGRLCGMERGDAEQARSICQRAVSMRATASNFNWLGIAQQRLGDDCAAEGSFTSARAMQRDSGTIDRNLGGAAMRCGHYGAAVEAFERAEQLDEGAAAAPGMVREDREYLMLAYERTQQHEKASVLCVRVHPAWASCRCELTKYGVECRDGATGRVR
jgi:tetratricopeptide (TPR) repeat protein